MDALAALLTRERLLVELVVFKLVELRQVLLAGETRFLGWAAEEVERATAGVRQAEIERAVLTAQIATERGLGDDATLTTLIDDAAGPWRTVLVDAQTALRASATEVTELLQETRRLSEAGTRTLEAGPRTVEAGSVSHTARTTRVARTARTSAHARA